MRNKFKSLFTAAPARSDYADAGDILRVLCMLMIGWFHIWQQSWLNPDFEIFGRHVRMYPAVACGYLFVDLLLLLSGFLLMLGYLSGRSRNLKSFYRARLVRILPSYLLCIVPLFVIAVINGSYPSSGHMFTDLFAHLSFTHTFFYESYHQSLLNGALWTLAIEMQFYLVFPLLAKAFEKKPALTYIAMSASAFAFRLYTYRCVENTAMYVNQLIAFMDVYANGMLSAMIYHRLTSGQRPQRAWSAWANTLLCALSAIAIYRITCLQFDLRNTLSTHLGQLICRLPLALAGCIFLVCGSRAVACVRRLFSNKVVRVLSALTFNFYIWHQYLAVKLKQWRIPPYTGDKPNQEGQMPWQWQYTLACFIGAFVLSVLITYLFEQPLVRRIKRCAAAKNT